MSSSMERLLVACPCDLGFRRRPRRAFAFPRDRIGLERRATFFINRTGRSSRPVHLLGRISARLYASDFLCGCRNPAERCAEIGQVDQRKQQTRDPKNVHMREQRNKTQDSDNLELQLVGSMRHALWQRMQPKE